MLAMRTDKNLPPIARECTPGRRTTMALAAALRGDHRPSTRSPFNANCGRPACVEGFPDGRRLVGEIGPQSQCTLCVATAPRGRLSPDTCRRTRRALRADAAACTVRTTRTSQHALDMAQKISHQLRAARSVNLPQGTTHRHWWRPRRSPAASPPTSPSCRSCWALKTRLHETTTITMRMCSVSPSTEYATLIVGRPLAGSP